MILFCNIAISYRHNILCFGRRLTNRNAFIVGVGVSTNFVPLLSSVKKWVFKFNCHFISYEDDSRGGRSKTATADKSIEKVYNMILNAQH